jgi:hypothetical protein
MKCTLLNWRSSLETISGPWADFPPSKLWQAPVAATALSPPGLYVLVPGHDGEPFAKRKGFDLVALRLQSWAGATWPSADSEIPDGLFHRGAVRHVASR